MIRISVCMASFNGSLFIKKQIISILCQLSNDDEIIISDDGSTDDTRQIVQSFTDHRITLINNEGRHGPIGNFENALRYSSGQFIFLADQDDIWFSNKINIICLLLRDHELVLADCEVVNLDGKVLHPSFFKYRGSRQGFWANVYQNSYIGCCMAFRREILEYILPFPIHIHMHDWWIGLLVEAKGRIAFYDKPLIKYVRHGTNASPTGELTKYGFCKQLTNRFVLLWNVMKRLLT